jgi:hypothetical protein
MRSSGRLLFVLVALASSRLQAGETGPVPRSEIEQLEAQLDQAVGKVSRASVGIVVGRAEGSRGYHLPGFGAVFVLAPRALPAPRGFVVWSQEVGPGAVLQLEQQVPSPAEPARPGAPPAAPRRQIRIRSGPQAVPLDPDEARRIAEMEAQVAAFQKEAEEARLVAEKEFEQLAIDVQVMLAPPPPGAALPPEAPTAPTAPRDVRAPARPPAAQAPPPWHFWFEPREARDARDPDQVVADVRAAVVATLEASGGQMTGLPPDEHVAVAVDFVAGGPFGPTRPAKTLVVRARRKDLDERARGKLSAEELRKRMEIVEY